VRQMGKKEVRERRDRDDLKGESAEISSLPVLIRGKEGGRRTVYWVRGVFQYAGKERSQKGRAGTVVLST